MTGWVLVVVAGAGVGDFGFDLGFSKSESLSISSMTSTSIPAESECLFLSFFFFGELFEDFEATLVVSFSNSVLSLFRLLTVADVVGLEASVVLLCVGDCFGGFVFSFALSSVSVFLTTAVEFWDLLEGFTLRNFRIS